MAVAFDAVANLGQAQSISGVSGPLTLGGSATALLVAVGGYGAGSSYSALTTWTVTCGVTPLVRLGVIGLNNNGTLGWVELWGLLSPPTGLQQITVIEKMSSTAAYINVTAISFTGVGQFGTPVPWFGTGTALTSGNVSSGTNNRVLSIHACANPANISSPSGTLRSNQPNPFVANYTSLLVQDAAGATTVTETSTLSSSVAWGVLSLNLIAGTPFSIGSTLSLTASTSQSASFVGQVWHVGASLALSVAPSVVGVAQPLGPPLRYVGRPPDTDSVLVPASYADVNNLVTSDWLTKQITQASQYLVTSAWIQGQINGTGANPVYLSQTAVTTALGAYTPTTALSDANGLAHTDGTGVIPAAQLPTLTTNNIAKCYDSVHNGTNFLAANTTFTVITQSVGEFVLANVVIPDPGYPWVPLPFAYVVGYSSGGTLPGNRLSGTSNFGALYVTAAGQTSPIYGTGICDDNPPSLPNYHCVVPGCVSTGTVTPQTQKPINGGATLQLSGCNWTSSGYTFEGTGLIFFVIVVPGVS